MERKIVLRKGPFRKILHLTGRKVVTHDYFPRPIIAEKAYQTMKDVWINKRGWSVEVKQKESVIIMPGKDTNEVVSTNNVMGIKTNFR